MSRIIKLAAQNETVRSTAGEHTDLATIGLTGCVAVIIKDDKRNQSLTHVDISTDLAFIKDEINTSLNEKKLLYKELLKRIYKFQRLLER